MPEIYKQSVPDAVFREAYTVNRQFDLVKAAADKLQQCSPDDGPLQDVHEYTRLWSDSYAKAKRFEYLDSIVGSLLVKLDRSQSDAPISLI